MGRHIALLLSTTFGLAALGCGDSNRESSPTSPDFAPSIISCDLSTARSLVSSIFPTQVRQTASSSLQAIQNAGAGTESATNAGFDLFSLVATDGLGSAQDRSTFVNAIIPCQNVGTVALPIDFTVALGPTGAFEVRGGLSSDDAAAVSQDGVWGIEPPFSDSDTPTKYTWDQITVPPIRFSPASNASNKRFLVYGQPVTDSDFTAEQSVGTIFDWSTLPKLSFSPGAVVGTCILEGESPYLIQHNDHGEIVPSATPTFCPVGLTSLGAPEGWSLSAIAQRVFGLLSPQPLLATAVGKIPPPGGSIGNLSPSVAVNPDTIKLAFPKQVADGKTNQQIKFKDGTAVSVTVVPAGGTKFDGARILLTAVANLGAPVTAVGNTAVSNDGVATFPDLKLSKAGGYRLVASITGFGQNNAAGFNIVQAVSNGFNLKQSK